MLIKNTIKTLMFLAVFTALQTVDAGAADADLRLKKLVALYKMNVSGDAYVYYCDKGNRTKGVEKTPVSAFYFSNAAAVKLALGQEIGVVFKDLTPKQVDMVVEKRRAKVMGSAFFYFDQKGCSSDKAQAARAHVVKMGRLKPSAFGKYLDTIETR